MKVTAEGWVDAAREALIADGLTGVRANRLAKSLGVTRGGFYYHFRNQQQLLDRLLEDWRNGDAFLPSDGALDDAQEARAYLERAICGQSKRARASADFEQAVREWGRVDAKVSEVVEKVDDERISRLTKVFAALGFNHEEAGIRARIFYFYQMGYYALGFQARDGEEGNGLNADRYLEILCGTGQGNVPMTH
ncbi:MAG: helix-turn-helix domain-containing protein [Pseudomonadota bacterium]